MMTDEYRKTFNKDTINILFFVLMLTMATIKIFVKVYTKLMFKYFVMSQNIKLKTI
jgi:hypothetical protein